MSFPAQNQNAATADRLSLLTGVNAEYISHLYTKYIKSKSSVDASWQSFFAGLSEDELTVLKEQNGASWTPSENRVESRGFANNTSAAPTNIVPMPQQRTGQAQNIDQSVIESTVRVHNLINAYRVYGHCLAQLDPLGLNPPTGHPALDPAHHKLTPAMENQTFPLMGRLGMESATLGSILQKLNSMYASTSAAEFMHIPDQERQEWIQNAFENRDTMAVTQNETRHEILNRLAQAEGFEQFLHKKFQGAKRFGLDGGEVMIPSIDAMINVCVNNGASEFVFGMAHRGRLNVLTNIMRKPAKAILAEFQGKNALPEQFTNVSSDVKYHMGYSNDVDINGKSIHMSLAYNPSHLEFVNAVVVGKTRAKQEHDKDKAHEGVVPIVIHGDAAFAGQGVTAETLMMSELNGYTVGGTIHIIINNQVGFTTRPEDARSGKYSSDLAKMIDAPILHVNGDDPDEVVRLSCIAADYRQIFKRDIVLDIVSYRRYGHNEGDEPRFTQPLMYDRIDDMTPVREKYAQQLVQAGHISQEDAQQYVDDMRSEMEQAYDDASAFEASDADVLHGKWEGISTAPIDLPRRASTGLTDKKFNTIGTALTTVPSDFTLNKKIERLLDSKKTMFKEGMGFDWGTAEAIAFGSLLKEGYNVRLSGQDVRRGTFSHRHAALYDQKNAKRYYPLNNIKEEQGVFSVYNSPLSECAVMGFEYGYSLASPNTLTLWEGQFGDFVNGAQVIIDQFMSSGESKWLRMSGLTLLLPHGFEGMGPEHSSARLERFLQNSAEDNWQVCYPTTPANYFHLLRRQLHRNFRKPLIIMAPKSLLRHKKCTSETADMVGQTAFRRVLWDMAENEGMLAKPKDIKRLILCSGKVYFDLYQAREDMGIKNINILRVDQLYPFPEDSLMEEIGRFPNADIIWCQEEPANQGAWTFMRPRLREVIASLGHKSKEVHYVGRPEGAAPATGLASRHKAEQDALIEHALTIKK